jgi:antirestriction protein ArdC
LTSAYLCAELRIPGTLRHPEYLASWVNVLRADARALLTAGARASEAADYLAKLAGRRPEESPHEESMDEAA